MEIEGTHQPRKSRTQEGYKQHRASTRLFAAKQQLLAHGYCAGGSWRDMAANSATGVIWTLREICSRSLSHRKLSRDALSEGEQGDFLISGVSTSFNRHRLLRYGVAPWLILAGIIAIPSSAITPKRCCSGALATPDAGARRPAQRGAQWAAKTCGASTSARQPTAQWLLHREYPADNAPQHRPARSQ